MAIVVEGRPSHLFGEQAYDDGMFAVHGGFEALSAQACELRRVGARSVWPASTWIPPMYGQNNSVQ